MAKRSTGLRKLSIDGQTYLWQAYTSYLKRNKEDVEYSWTDVFRAFLKDYKLSPLKVSFEVGKQGSVQITYTFSENRTDAFTGRKTAISTYIGQVWPRN